MNEKVRAQTVTRWPIWVVGALLVLFGLAFVVGGAYLASLGGSWYFVLSGLGLLASSALLFKSRPSGAWLFALVTVLTLSLIHI